MSDALVTSSIREEKIPGGAGLQIFVRSRQPAGEPRAVVVICHGVNSHSGYYLWTIDQLVAAGFAVYALDLHGRGQSDGERFYLEKIAHYVGDVHAVVTLAKSRHAGLPVYLLGHSAGGVVSCTYVLDHPHELAGLICESFAFKVAAPDIALAVVKGLSHLAPHVHVLRLKNEEFSRDPEVVAAMNSDPLIEDEVQPTQTVAELVRADERLDESFSSITIPVLILHGTADKVTNPSGSQRFYATAGSVDKTLKLYDGHVHDLLSDIGRERVMGDIRSWLEARLPA